MCCNADILFSVLVVHWVTTKDSASNLSARNSYHATNRLERFGFSNQVQPKVTTLISAVRDVKGEIEDDEIGAGYRNNSADDSVYPVEAIRVQSDQVVEFEGGSETSGGSGNGLTRGGSHSTIEDLVEKPPNCVTRTPF